MANPVSISGCEYAKTISKSDTDDIDPPNPKYISVNTAGDLKLVYRDGDGETPVVTMTVAVGVMYRISPKRINSTSTTADGIVAHYGG